MKSVVKKTPSSTPPAQRESGELVAFAQDGMPSLEVRLEGETIWLTQKQMAELFGRSEENIRLHVKNIYAIGELEENATSKDFLEVRLEGKRKVTRKFSYYNLDVAISVGYPSFSHLPISPSTRLIPSHAFIPNF